MVSSRSLKAGSSSWLTSTNTTLLFSGWTEGFLRLTRQSTLDVVMQPGWASLWHWIAYKSPWAQVLHELNPSTVYFLSSTAPSYCSTSVPVATNCCRPLLIPFLSRAPPFFLHLCCFPAMWVTVLSLLLKRILLKPALRSGKTKQMVFFCFVFFSPWQQLLNRPIMLWQHGFGRLVRCCGKR